MTYLKLLTTFTLIFSSLGLADVGAEEVRFKMGWNYKNFPFAVKLYEVPPTSPLWSMASVKSLPKELILKEIPDNLLIAHKGRRNKFALVIHNTSNQVQYFFASPHSAEPAEHSIGFKYNCLCMNHSFKIQPNSYWYRTVELRVSNKYEAPPKSKPLEITHDIIGLDVAKGKLLQDTKLPESEK